MATCSCCNIHDEYIKINCEQCNKGYHLECLKYGRPSPIEGDTFFHLLCAECHPTREEVLDRMKLPWLTVVHLTLYNLQLQGGGKCGFFKWKDNICTYIDRHWRNFFPCDKKKSATWQGTIAGVLSNGSPQYFSSGSSVLSEAGWWKLTDNKPPTIEQLQTSSKVYKGKSSHREPTNLTVVCESGRSSRTKVSSIQAAMEIKARRDSTLEAKEIKRRKMATKNTPAVKTQPSSSSILDCKEKPIRHMVSIVLPILKQEPTSFSNDAQKNKDIEKASLNISKKTFFSETVSALLGDKESDSDIEIDPCALSSDEIGIEQQPTSPDISNQTSNDTNQQWEEIMAPFCAGSGTITAVEESVMIKEEPVIEGYEENCVASCAGDSSINAQNMIENNFSLSTANILCVKEEILNSSDYLSNYEHSEYPELKRENDVYSRPSSSVGYVASESEREETISHDVSCQQSEAEIESEVEETRSGYENDYFKTKRTRKTKKQIIKKEPEPSKERYVGISVYEEKQLLSELQRGENMGNRNAELARFRRKLLLREIKREHGLPTFDLDSMMNRLVGQRNQLYGIQMTKPQQDATLQFSKKQSSPRRNLDSKSANILDRFQRNHKVKPLRAGVSFLNKLVGTDDDQLHCIRSPYTARLLKPFIRRDYDTRTKKMNLLMDIQAHPHRNDPTWKNPDPPPIDYCYVQPQHIPSVNALCQEFFWPGIDLSECLQYPDFSCVVLYRKFVIGFAFMVPDVKHNEAYISFLFTHPEWRGAGIATFMVYHLIQTCMGKDITIHVSANNPAMLLYQKFGFKPEEFILDFYEKYFPADSKESRHAFFLRLRR